MRASQGGLGSERTKIFFIGTYDVLVINSYSSTLSTMLDLALVDYNHDK